MRFPTAKAKQPGRPKNMPYTGCSISMGRMLVNPGITESTLKGRANARYASNSTTKRASLRTSGILRMASVPDAVTAFCSA